MRETILLIALLALTLAGCTSDEPDSPEVQPPTSENIYLEFNQWIYSQMNRQYLWREDMPDSLDCNYDMAPRDFFESLLSKQDRFSYFTNNPSYSGRAAVNYGFEYQKVRDVNHNEALQILYVYSSRAKAMGIHRGDYVRVESENSGFVKLRKLSLKDGLFMDSNEPVEFTIDDITGPKSSVLLDTIYSIRNKRIGYLCYLEYDGTKDLYEPLQRFLAEGITDLILDLRYNPGGYVSTCQYLCNCIVPASGYGNMFQQCSYNDILSMEYKKSTGDERTYSFFSFPTSPDKPILDTGILGLQLKQLYVLTSRYTASASEATIVCLRPYMEVKTVGEQTVGKGVGSWNISSSKYPYSLQPITMRYYNAYDETTPDEGLTPDYYVPDGYTVSKKDIGDTSETLLHTTISLIVNQSWSRSNDRVSGTGEYTIIPIGEPSYMTDFKNKPH